MNISVASHPNATCVYMKSDEIYKNEWNTSNSILMDGVRAGPADYITNENDSCNFPFHLSS